MVALAKPFELRAAIRERDAITLFAQILDVLRRGVAPTDYQHLLSLDMLRGYIKQQSLFESRREAIFFRLVRTAKNTDADGEHLRIECALRRLDAKARASCVRCGPHRVDFRLVLKIEFVVGNNP